MIWRKGRLFPHEWTPAHIGPFSHIGSLLIVLPVLLAVRQRRQTHGCNLYHHYHHRIIVIKLFWPSIFELSETRGFYQHDIIRRRRSLDLSTNIYHIYQFLQKYLLENFAKSETIPITFLHENVLVRIWKISAKFWGTLKVENFMNCKFWETHIRFYKLQSTLIPLHSAK